jgi:hypothetical protein
MGIGCNALGLALLKEMLVFFTTWRLWTTNLLDLLFLNLRLRLHENAI